ncbi:MULTISPECIES: EsaB/YukD family protein [unclassified Clavibacter]|uniref:EsaB/YukD family protein n=1 Tax=unclassified Clavibacter TaxID=2626594 RepID=UPI0022EA5EEA|nr:EsaB/YukD family protein [Clavibacter sp. CT19]MDA3804394.1 EsaB/YukD family protein [Clavibacter sp. CT19]
MSTFTRVTVLGSHRRVDLVAPSDEAVAALIAQLVELLGERTESAARPMTLIRASGDQLGAEESLDDQGVLAGDVLRLVRVDDAPAPPEVADVTDVVAEARDDQGSLWADVHRISACCVAIALLAGVAGASLVSPDAVPELGGGALLLAVAAAVLGLVGAARPALVLTAAAAGLAVPATVAAVDAWMPGGASLPVLAFATSGAAWLVVGVGIGVGLRRRTLLRGSVVGVAASAVALGVDLLGMTVPQESAVVGTAAVVLIGLLPWYSMTASGLTGLDDLVIAGTLSDRDTLRSTVDEAYRSLSWASLAAAVPAAIAAGALVGTTDPWPIALGVCLTLVLALRTRAFPLAWQALPLWAAVAAVIVIAALAHGSERDAVAAGLGAVMLACAAVCVARPSLQTRARLRRVGNRVETLAVVALVPCVIGVFGVYPSLLGTF